MRNDGREFIPVPRQHHEISNMTVELLLKDGAIPIKVFRLGFANRGIINDTDVTQRLGKAFPIHLHILSNSHA